MMRSRPLRWIASLATVVLLLPGCDGSDDAAADTTLAATTTAVAPTTTTTAVEPFDFSTQSLCDWFSPEEIDAIVTSTYETVGVPLNPSYEMDELHERSHCFWAEPVVTLSADDGTLEWGTGEFIPVQVKSHPALDDSVRVSIQRPGFYGFDIEGVDAVLKVDGHAELLFFGHTTDGLGDDVETMITLGLTIANEMLEDMGWIEPTAPTTAAVEPFDFSSQDLCEWFSAEEIDTIVARAYEDNDASPIPPAFEEGASSSDSRYPDCWWHSGDISTVGLAAIRTGPFYDYDADGPIDERWRPHPALSEGVYVDQEVVVGSHDDYVPGVELRLLVEGQEHAMEYWHRVPPGFDGDADAVLAIADEMLRSMGWVPVPGD